MPLISIIVPVYNVEKYLRACLDSIINQTYKELEIILVDDGSTDSSGNICDEYALIDTRVRVLHNINCGVSGARNSGLEVASGEGVCFIDSDDTVEEKYIENLVNTWVEYHCDLVICNIKDIYPDTVVFKRKVGNELTGIFREDYWKLVNLLRVPVVKLYKSEIIKQYTLRFPTSIHTAEDQIWNFNYFSHVNSYSYVCKSLYNYFHRDNISLSQLKDYKSYLANISKLNFEKTFLEANKIENGNLVLTNHALGTLKHFAFLSDRDNDYSTFKNRWEKVKSFIDTNVEADTTKRKVLFYLIKNNLIFFIYLYYVVSTSKNRLIRRILKRCTPPPTQPYLVRRVTLA